MKSHFLLWRESWYYASLDFLKVHADRVSYWTLCANDLNVFVSCESKDDEYFLTLEKLKSFPGIRKIISFPVKREIYTSSWDRNALSIVVAVRMNKTHNRTILGKIIKNNHPQWADEVEGIFSYLISFSPENPEISTFLKQLYLHKPEYIEPLVLLPEQTAV